MLALSTIPVVVLVVAVLFAVVAQREAAAANEEVDRSNAVARTLAEIQDDLSVAESDVRGYLLTGRPGFKENYQHVVVSLQRHLAEIELIVEDPLQRKRLARLNELVEERLRTFEAVHRLGGSRSPAAQRRLETWLLHGQTIAKALRDLTEVMEVTAERLAVERVRARDEAFDRSYVVQVLAMPAAVLTAMLLMIAFTAGIVRRVAHMQHNARRLERGIEMHEADPSADELGSLSRALVRTGSHLSRLQEELRQLATVDQLTGLANRRGFFSLANHQLLVAARTRAAVALMFMDADGLKRVNDELGHAAGDDLLIEVADVIRETIRTSDLAGRLGGDEFCVLLMGDPDLDADRVVARLRQTEAAHNTRQDRMYRLSLSIGVAALPPGRSVTLAELIDAADEAMYADKRSRHEAATATTA
jgi:diguanylate cyclase (GGDEF)-like protein